MDKYVPVYAGEYTAAECMGRDKYIIDGKEYEECDFCRAVCPSRDRSKNPIPVCLSSAICVKVKISLCVSSGVLAEALIVEEREEEVEEAAEMEDVEIRIAIDDQTNTEWIK